MLGLGSAKPRFQVCCPKKSHDASENPRIHWTITILSYVLRAKARMWGDQKAVVWAQGLGKLVSRPCILVSTCSPVHDHDAMAPSLCPLHTSPPPPLPPLTFPFINPFLLSQLCALIPLALITAALNILGRNEETYCVTEFGKFNIPKSLVPRDRLCTAPSRSWNLMKEQMHKGSGEIFKGFQESFCLSRNKSGFFFNVKKLTIRQWWAGIPWKVRRRELKRKKRVWKLIMGYFKSVEAMNWLFNAYSGDNLFPVWKK